VVRIPVDADQNVQNAFRDVVQELEDLKAALGVVSDGVAASDVPALRDQLAKLPPPPQFDSDKNVFVGSGPQHSVGLVPDPGASAGTSQVLNENGTWRTAQPAVLNDEEQTPEGVTDIYQIPGALVVAGEMQVGEVTTAQINTDKANAAFYGGGLTLLYSRDSNVVGAASETTAATVTVDASRFMAKNGDRIIIEQWGTITQVTWTLKSYYGSAVITSWSDLGYGGPTFLFRVTTVITRTGSATQSIRSQVSAYNTGGGGSVMYTPAYVAGAQSNSGMVVVKTTITDAGADATENSCYIYALTQAA